MKSYEAVEKTADEAIEKVLSEMGVTIDMVDIEVDEASKGLFGFLKQKQVRVIATLKPEFQDKEEEIAAKFTQKTVAPVKESKESNTNEINIPENTLNLELQNDAKEIIREFIGHIANGIQKDIEVNVKEEKNTVKIDISGEDVSLLIGKHGKTLDALRTLLSLMINRGLGKDDLKRVLLDVEGYRKKRDNTLERIARSTATKVIKTKKEVAMDPMNPYERRIIHSVLQRNKLVSTRSEGEEPERHVVVFLK